MNIKKLTTIIGIVFACAFAQHIIADDHDRRREDCDEKKGCVTKTNTLEYAITQEFLGAKYTNNIPVPQFNPTNGTLVKVEVGVTLYNLGIFAIEIQDYAIMLFNVTNTVSFLGANLELDLITTNQFNATTYDGVLDYSGTSGTTVTNQNQQSFIVNVSPIDVIGTSTWNMTNSANCFNTLIVNSTFYSYVNTQCAMQANVVYTYTTTTCGSNEDDDDREHKCKKEDDHHEKCEKDGRKDGKSDKGNCKSPGN